MIYFYLKLILLRDKVKYCRSNRWAQPNATVNCMLYFLSRIDKKYAFGRSERRKCENKSRNVLNCNFSLIRFVSVYRKIKILLCSKDCNNYCVYWKLDRSAICKMSFVVAALSMKIDKKSICKNSIGNISEHKMHIAKLRI